MLPQSYKFSHCLLLDNFLQVLLICNQRDQIPLFVYINQSDEVSYLVRGSKVLGDMKYLSKKDKGERKNLKKKRTFKYNFW